MTHSQESDDQNTPNEAVPTPEEAPKPATPGKPTPASVKPGAVKPSSIRPAAPSAGRPADATSQTTESSAHSVTPPPSYSTDLEEARRFARVAEDGHVFVLVNGEEHPVGQYPDASADEALAYFVRKYDDVVNQLLLLEHRVAAKAPTTDMNKTLDHLAETVAAKGMVGDLPAVEERIEKARADVAQLHAAEKKAHDEAREVHLAEREQIVAEAEELAGRDPEKVQWKQSSQRMNELFDLWKAAQKSGMRLGRGTEDSLWKRFRSARTTFDRHRRAFFSQLDADHSEAKRAKEALIARAEELSTSTDWGHTAGEYRKLMSEWKASKRAARKDDDALWARFRAAQDVFFAARNETNAALDAEFEENLKVKEALLEKARAIDPAKDLAAAKKSLDSIREQWDAAGKVPRSAMHRIEASLRQVEDAVKDAEDHEWRRSNPETKARSNSMLEQLQDSIAQLESELEAAKAGGNQRTIKQAEEALEARRTWLQTVEASARELN
ncbi:DUF349 domain-containing protein [Zhihengliuella salsuginis]|uniref:DUF349 domain-containing protein n=1 Tax=Zhihengliuella salsuginis TaxID=578222 RepID=A0ABQ3GK89_9MICC|nr:DUF349 domain-containing protein [Zhihengliuella salsuginis]GHD12106.1 hypothetical protein GCM10008096_27210 [Zhihengliuella salsuginis]